MKSPESHLAQEDEVICIFSIFCLTLHKKNIILQNQHCIFQASNCNTKHIYSIFQPHNTVIPLLSFTKIKSTFLQHLLHQNKSNPLQICSPLPLSSHTFITLFPLFTNLSKKAFNSLPNHKILGFTKLKAFADNKFNVAKLMIFLFNSIPDDKF